MPVYYIADLKKDYYPYAKNLNAKKQNVNAKGKYVFLSFCIAFLAGREKSK
jgi:hypothetical protein